MSLRAWVTQGGLGPGDSSPAADAAQMEAVHASCQDHNAFFQSCRLLQIDVLKVISGVGFSLSCQIKLASGKGFKGS